MHPNLAPHLHTPECNAIVQKLIQCREQHKVGRLLLGSCNDLDRELTRCLNWERSVYRKINSFPKSERSKVLLEERRSAPSFEQTLAYRRERLLDKIKALDYLTETNEGQSQNVGHGSRIQHHTSGSTIDPHHSTKAAGSSRFGSAWTTSAPSIFGSGSHSHSSGYVSSPSENDSPEVLSKPHPVVPAIHRLTAKSRDGSFSSDSPKDFMKTTDDSEGHYVRHIPPYAQSRDDLPIISVLMPEARPLQPISHRPGSSHQLEKENLQLSETKAPQAIGYKPSSSHQPSKENSTHSSPKVATARPKSAVGRENPARPSSMNKSHTSGQGSSEKNFDHIHREPQFQPIPLPAPPSHQQPSSQPSHVAHVDESSSVGHQDGQSGSSVTLRIGRNNYRVLRQIGSGGFSSVFSVASETDGRQYALKQVRVPSEHHLNDAMREANLLRGLADTGCVVRVFEVAAVRKKTAALMILMELGNGDLSSWMKSLSTSSPPLPAFSADPCLCRSVFTYMVRAIALLHSRGIVHNDLKPSNWLFTKHGRLKLIDFGVSRQLAVDKTSQVELDKLCGTLDYMSPERLSDRRTSPAGDIWALGCILHELAFGWSPFAHLDTALAKISKIAAWPNEFDIPYTPRELLHETCDKVQSSEPNLVSLIRSCLMKAPKTRPTANDMLSHPFIAESEHTIHLNSISVQDAVNVLRAAANRRPSGDERRHFVSSILDCLLDNNQQAPRS